MKFLLKHGINILKGAAIGIANVIPGFSGGTMAVLLKIYDLFVYAFANIFNDFKNVVKKCWSLFFGILLGVLFAMVVIVKLLEVIPFITIMFFVGLILGSIPQIFAKTRKGKLKSRDIISFILSIVIIVGLPFINTANSTNVEFNIGLYLLMVVMGAICAGSMVIPGVSGSLVLMAFGYYVFLFAIIEEYLKNIFNFSMDNYWNMFITIGSFAIGCVLGIVFISKLITKLTEKYPKTVYCTILGLLIASPFAIIYATMTSEDYVVVFNTLTIIFSVISLLLGTGIVLLGEYLSKNHKNKEEIEEEGLSK